MQKFIYRLIFSLRKTDIVDQVLKSTQKYFPKNHREEECLRPDVFPYLYDLIRIVPVNNNMLDNEGNIISNSALDISGETSSPHIWATLIPICFFASLALIVSTVILKWSFLVPATVFNAYLLEASSTTSPFLVSHFSAFVLFELVTIFLNSLALIPLWAVIYYLYVVIAEADPSRVQSHFYWFWATVLCGVIVLLPVVGPILVICASILAMFVLPAWIKLKALARTQMQNKAAIDSSQIAASQDFLNAKEMHAAQIDTIIGVEDENNPGQYIGCRRDPLIVLARSHGTLNIDGDALTPDPPSSGSKYGAPICIDSGDDLALPTLVTGSSGSGKTALLLSWVIQEMEITGFTQKIKEENYKKYGRRRGAGMYIIDAKAAIPVKLDRIAKRLGIEDFILVTPETHHVNFLEAFGDFETGKYDTTVKGLQEALAGDEIVIDIIVGICGSGNGQSKEIWTKAMILTLKCMLHLLSFNRYLKANGLEYYKSEGSINRVVRSMISLHHLTMQESADRDAFVAWLQENYMGTIEAFHPLFLALEHFTKTIPGTPAATAGSIFFTINTDLSGIVGSVRLQNWMGERNDILIAKEVSRNGKFIALLSPEIKYGKAGIFCSQMGEGGMYYEYQTRPIDNPDWEALGQYAGHIFADEYGSLVTPKAHILSMSREYKLYMTAFMQNDEQFAVQLGNEHVAKSIRKLFLQQITFKSDLDSIKNRIDVLNTRTRYTQVDMTTKIPNHLDALKGQRRSGIKDKSAGALFETSANILAVFNTWDRKFSMHGHDRAAVQSIADKFASADYKEVLGPTITAEEARPILSKEFACLINITRAKGIVNEFGRAVPYFERYPELRNSPETRADVEELLAGMDTEKEDDPLINLGSRATVEAVHV